jgi:ATP-dependent Clp protease ATP-binding subunit ClpA
MFCVERLARTVEHQRGEAAVERFAAFLEGVAVVEMGDDRHGRVFGQMAEHLAQHRQRRVRPARRAGLQDHRRPSASAAAT